MAAEFGIPRFSDVNANLDYVWQHPESGQPWIDPTTNYGNYEYESNEDSIEDTRFDDPRYWG